MLTIFLKRAIRDILNNRFLNAVTTITITLSVLTVSAFTLFINNVTGIMDDWEKGIRIMAYLRVDVPEAQLVDTKSQIQKMKGIDGITYISKQAALARLKTFMKRQSSLLDDLNKNPLPDAFEIRVTPDIQSVKHLETLAVKIESLPAIDQVVYGERWFQRFKSIVNLFKLAGWITTCIFFAAAVFIVANTIRLILYSRRDEIEIMRLVGASDNFIKAPFYIEGILQGAMGGGIGLLLLFIAYLLLVSNMALGFAPGIIHIRFLGFETLIGIIFGSAIVGWLGCYLSLKQFFKV